MAFRSSLRDTLWAIAGKSGVASLAGRALHSSNSLRILMYHDVPQQVLPTFESHLKWLAQRFEIITPKDFMTGSSKSNLPKVLLTFDDGCQDNYELVAPLLESQGLRDCSSSVQDFPDSAVRPILDSWKDRRHCLAKTAATRAGRACLSNRSPISTSEVMGSEITP